MIRKTLLAVAAAAAWGAWRWDGERYTWQRGNRRAPWGQRDNDGDGVRNRFDRFPNDPDRS